MDINSVIQQVKQFAPIFKGKVAGAAEMQMALNQSPTTDYPWAYCFPLGSTAAPNTSFNGLDQLVTETFAVVVILDNSKISNDRRGQAAASYYPTVRAQLWQALLNFVLDPYASSHGCQFEGDELVSMDPKRAVYEFKFSQTILITDEQGFQPVGTPLDEIDFRIVYQYDANSSCVSNSITIVSPAYSYADVDNFVLEVCMPLTNSGSGNPPTGNVINGDLTVNGNVTVNGTINGFGIPPVVIPFDSPTVSNFALEVAMPITA